MRDARSPVFQAVSLIEDALAILDDEGLVLSAARLDLALATLRHEIAMREAAKSSRPEDQA